MEKLENESICVYQDTANQESVKRELSQALSALQSVLTIWNDLDLIPCTDIRALILNPQKAYSEAVNELAVVPVTAGRFQVSKQAYINTLDIPIPDSLYRICKAARQHSFAAVNDLWSIEGDQVIMNTIEASNYIDSQSIYSSDPEKIAVIKDVLAMCDMINKLNEKFKGQFYPFNRGVFNFHETPGRDDIMEIKPTIEYLKRLTQ